MYKQNSFKKIKFLILFDYNTKISKVFNLELIGCNCQAI